MVIAATVRFSFRAIKGLSIFDSSNAKSCASSAGVHGPYQNGQGAEETDPDTQKQVAISHHPPAFYCLEGSS
jgi:hypothetical protein